MCHYVSLSSCAYDSSLFSSQVEVDPTYGNDLLHLVKRNIRGGFVIPYMVANNPHVNPDFNSGENDSSYILYYDYNSFFASVMCSPLPKGNMHELN